ncbi:MAG: condensation domain-containing protein, partial [Acidimicrobiia bacterium]
GLSRGQFFETRLTEELFTELSVTSDQIDASVLEARKAYHRVDDAVKRLLDVSVFDDETVFDEVTYVDFYRYVDVGLAELYSYLDRRVPWVRPSDTGRSTNCLINDVGIYYHRKTRGYHNYALPYSWDVRMGHKTRDAAIDELDDEIDVAEVARMLDEIGFPDDVTGSDSGRSLVSYYVAPVEIPTPKIREHMAATLPRQLVPSRVVRLDALPLTANGKVDRKQLPAADAQRPDMETAFVAPQSDAELLLARIWEQVLGVEGIGIRDNYFDLGGDSITAVQIIARAHRHGLPITMNQLADELTIENLAAVSVRTAAPTAERLIGPVGLTPIQEWFFEEVEDSTHFHHVAHVERAGGIDGDRLASALAALTDHHDALRQSFQRTGQGWVSSIEDAVPAIPLEIVEAGESSNPDDLTAPFDLSRPPLMRASLRHSDDGSSELVIVAHHLIVDGVSWSHFIDDLGYLTSSDDGDISVLPSVTSSIGDWMGLLTESAATTEVAPWMTVVSTEAASWPAAETNVHEEGLERVDSHSTAVLLAGATELGMGLDELLTAAIAIELQKSTSTPTIRLFLEGHGRESDSSDVDVTRTMGWFTSLYPVVVRQSGELDSTLALHDVRDQVRMASRSGADYGVLRYLSADPNVRENLTLDYSDHLVVNYLGRVANSQTQEDEPFTLARPFALERPPGRNRIFGGEIMAYIADDALVVEWTTDQSSAGLLRDLVRAAIDAMVNLAADESGAPTAFPLAGLDDDGMSKLAGLLGTAEEGA